MVIKRERSSVEVFEIPPDDFFPKVEVASCYLEHEGNLLFLKRAEGKLEGGKWGVPAGKLEGGETPLKAVVREVFEETQVSLDKERIQDFGKLFMRHIGVADFVFHMFFQECSVFPDVCLNGEHEEYQWLPVDRKIEVPIMDGGEEALDYFRKMYRKWKVETDKGRG